MAESTPPARPAPPPPPPITELELTDDIKQAINGALENGTPIIISYVDADGQLSLSFRGSIQAYGDKQLSLWVRNPEGGILKAISSNPRISTLSRDPATRMVIITRGRAHAESDEKIRKAAYENAPEAEQKSDADRKGVAVIVDLDGVDGRSQAGAFSMRKGGA